MSSLTVMIIRHAEKPGEAFPGPGLTDAGKPDKHALVVRGRQRAGAWTALFGTGLGGGDYPGPALIYAASPRIGHDGGTASLRALETVQPLGDRLGLMISNVRARRPWRPGSGGCTASCRCAGNTS